MQRFYDGIQNGVLLSLTLMAIVAVLLGLVLITMSVAIKVEGWTGLPADCVTFVLVVLEAGFAAGLIVTYFP